jgi:hypothetical protein
VASDGIEKDTTFTVELPIAHEQAIESVHPLNTVNNPKALRCSAKWCWSWTTKRVHVTAFARGKLRG